ncbi:hypothetical protein [Pontibacter mucosus]|uniref:hypothetical protein n=1 Tax=Pontibacter mucosus TaxID=1649266 RepID=UPI0011B1EF8C|nr:hypothetical protein [Pontibacter mucosus]
MAMRIIELYFHTCLNQDFQDEWITRSLYFCYTFIFDLFPLFRTSLSGTNAAADFQIRSSHTFILPGLYFLWRKLPLVP